MELKIYDKQGLVKMTVSPDNSSQWNHEVGVENVVTVNFTTWEFLVLEVGWYILVEGQQFSIKSEYRPKHIHDTKYTYNLKFYGREHDAQDILFCRLNQGEDDLESVFAYDGTPMDYLQKVVANMNRNTDGVEWKAGEAISANRQTINFNGLYCWDALGEIARAFGTEWWMDGEYLNISKCERGESVSLGYGQGLKSGLTQNENTNAVKWFTRLIPVGSSKNIDKNKYGYATLQLPGREKYIDINTQYGLKEYREEAAFSEIYPHRVGTISSVRSETKIDDQGEEYLIYYVKDTELPFNPDNYMLPGEVIHMSFNSGNLAGKEFEVNWNNSTEEFEIINQYPEYVDQLPGGNLIPSSGDQYVLSNISMPDEYNTIAEEAYQSAVDKYIQEYDIDISIYSGVTDYIYISKNNISLSLGNRVNLISKRYFDSGNRGSRITRISRKLNNLSEMTLECSNTISSTWKQTLDSSINNTIVNQQKTQVKTDKNEKDIAQVSGLWELKKAEDGVEYLYTKFNVLTALGFTSYSIGKEKRFPSIYDGLPIDNQTLYWVTDENGKKVMLKAKGGGSGEGGGIEYALSWSGYSSGSWDGSSAKNIYIPSKVSELSNDSAFITSSALNNYATKDFVTGKGYITASALNGYATESYVDTKFSGCITDIVNVKATVGGATIDRYLGITKNGTTSNFQVGYANHAELLKLYDISTLSNSSAWNTTRGLKCSGFSSSATDIPTAAGNNANAMISCMSLWNYGFQIAYLNSLSTGYDSIPHLYFRNFVNGSYKGWYRIVTDGSQVQFQTIDWNNPHIRIRYQNGSWYYIQSLSDGLWLGQSTTNGVRIDSSGNILATGGITMYSDKRKKTILNRVQLSLREVADAPLIEHYYNSDTEKTTHVGSIAQYWAGLNDWFCKVDADGFYTMEVQNAALASAISVARELLKYETKTDKQIRKLKKRISELEEEVELLKKM